MLFDEDVSTTEVTSRRITRTDVKQGAGRRDVCTENDRVVRNVDLLMRQFRSETGQNHGETQSGSRQLDRTLTARLQHLKTYTKRALMISVLPFVHCSSGTGISNKTNTSIWCNQVHDYVSRSERRTRSQYGDS